MTDTGHVLILAASGKSGRRVVARLRLLGASVRAASRSSPTRFDWARPDTWEPVLEGVSSIYLVSPGEIGPVHDFVAHAERAGVRRVVALSGRRADSWGDSRFGRDMVDAEVAVRDSSLEWTIVRANNFYQNFDEELFYAPVLAGQLSLPARGVAEPFVDLEDVADVIVAALTDPSHQHAGRTLELTGPRAITFEEAVDIIARATGREIAFTPISADDYAAALSAAHGLGLDEAQQLVAMYELMERGLIASTTEDVQRVLGRPATTFEQYVLRTAVKGVWDAPS